MANQSENPWHDRGYLPHYDKAGVYQFVTFRLADSLPQEVLQKLEASLGTRSSSSASANENETERLRRIWIEEYLDAGMGSCSLREPAIAECVKNAFLHRDGKKYNLVAWCIMPNHIHVLIQPQISLSRIVQSWKSFTGRFALGYLAEKQKMVEREVQAELELRVPSVGVEQDLEKGDGYEVQAELELRVPSVGVEQDLEKGGGYEVQAELELRVPSVVQGVEKVLREEDVPSKKRFWMPDYWDRFIRDEHHFVKTIEYIHNNPVKAGLVKEASEWQWSSVGV